MTSSEQDTVSTTTRRRLDLATGPVARLERMLEIRAVEEAIADLFAAGEVRGTTHLGEGQEAVAVGIATGTRPGDLFTCTYRGHGLALALGMTPAALIGEVMGRRSGCIQGLGGSMHLSDPQIGLLPTFAIVGAGIPVAAGAALAAQLRGTDAVAVSVFGDGATNIGAFHEALNLAAVWSLPVVFVCENNLYGEYSRIEDTTSVTELVVRAGSYGMPGEQVDGQDVDAVTESVRRAADRARAGEGPTFIEAKTYRYSGHSRSDTGPYRRPGELERWRARDPIAIARHRLLISGDMDDTAADQLAERVRATVAAAVADSRIAPEPPLAAMFSHVYA